MGCNFTSFDLIDLCIGSNGRSLSTRTFGRQSIIIHWTRSMNDFRSTGAVNSCDAPSDALIETGLSGSGLWARFLSVRDSPGPFSEQNGANEVLPCHAVVVIELGLLQVEDVLFCHFFEREREEG